MDESEVGRRDVQALKKAVDWAGLYRSGVWDMTNAAFWR